MLWGRVSILTALSAGMVLGQSSPATDSIQLGSVDFSATLRLRLYGWDWFQPAAGENAYACSGDLLRLNFSRKLDRWDWDAEFAVLFLLDLPDKATDAAPQGALGLGSNDYTANHSSRFAAMIFPKRLFVNLRDLGSQASSLQIGRFEFLDGSEIAPKNATLAAVKRDRVAARLIGNFAF